MNSYLLTQTLPELPNHKKKSKTLKWISTISIPVFLGQNIILKASFSIMLIQQTFVLESIIMVFTLGNLQGMDSGMALVLSFTSMGVAIKETLSMTKRRAKAFNIIKMVLHILESF